MPFRSISRCLVSFFSTNTTKTISKDSSLFARIGGDQTFDKLLSHFTEKLSKNGTLLFYFKKMKPEAFLSHQRQILSVILGKELKYSLKDLRLHHISLEIREADFDFLTKELSLSLKELGIRDELIEEALGHIEKQRRFIIAQTLFQKLGNDDARIKEITASFFTSVLKDAELRHFFLAFDVKKLQSSYAQYFSQLFGGPHKYVGKDLQVFHKGFELTNRHFYLYKRYLARALRNCRVDARTSEEALHRLEKLRNIVLNTGSTLEKLGDEQGLREIIESFFEKVKEDPLLSRVFQELSAAETQLLCEKLKDFLSFELGEPSRKGNIKENTESSAKEIERKDLKQAHWRLHLSDFHVDAFKNCMQKVLKDRNLEDSVIRDVIWVFERKRREVCAVNIFEIIGGEPTIAEMAATLWRKVRKNDRLQSFFEKHSDEELRYILRSMLSYALGGPRAFRGKDIRACHGVLKVEEREFEEMKRLVRETLGEMGVVASLIEQQMNVFESRREDVVVLRF